MTKLKNIAVAVASLVIFSNITNAQAAKQSYQAAFAEPFSVKYLGIDGDYLLFQVNVQSNNPGNALFEIADKSEGSLYATNLKNVFSKQTIKIEKRNEQVLDFKLVLGNKTYSKSFSVNTNQVEKTTVSEGDITML